VVCPNCGAANPSDGRFCLECGTSLAPGCPNCGALNPSGAKFCGTCGTRLGPAEDAAPFTLPAPPAGIGRAPTGDAASGAADEGAIAAATERRVVSVLFADLVGFTVLSSSLDPESVRELQDRYFERAREIVGRYGGAIEKFIGDAVMAVWGAPIAHEDDAERAVRAALELVDAVPVLGREAGHELQLRAGVLTGEAAVSAVAVDQGMVTGDLVNTAARLQSVAPPSSVLVGEATRLATESAVVFEPAGEQVLKGKAAPVSAWRALRVVGERGGARRPEALEPPFVGRADELRFLKEQFHATGREGRARLVSLVGQAGIGKSRLAWELEKYLDGVVEQVWWHRGRAPSYGAGVSFWALGEMIRRRAGLAESDDDETTRQAIAAMVARHVPDEAERAWIEPKMLALLGMGDAGPGGRQELFAAWRTFFERLAATGTVAFVIEDLQWSDDGLLDFLEHLLDWGRTSPIFVLTLARPELLERRQGWGTDRRGASSLRLDPLTDDAMRELLEGIVPGLPEAAVRRILDRADGIPLYAVETVRMLLGMGRLAPEGDHFVPVGDLTAGEGLRTLAVPPTLHALVAARLDALPGADRSLLQDAAVLGQSFTQEALAALSGEAPDALGARLDQLVRREILTIETDPRAPTRGQHAFVQALVREVAYGTLSKKERRARHLAAARYFETIADEELAGVVATHFVAAYRAAPEGPEGEAVATQARISLLGAAERAQALGAMGQAIESLSSALEVSRDPIDRARILERLGLVQTFHIQFDEGEANLAAAAAAYEAIGDRVGVIRATALRMQGHTAAARISSAMEVAESLREEAEALAAASAARVGESSLLTTDERAAAEAAAAFAENFGRILFRQAHSDAAVEWCDRALRIAEPLRLDEHVAMALVTKGSALLLAGRRREGRALLEGAVIDARSHGQSLAALRGGVNLASFTHDIDPRASLDRTMEGMALARRLGLRSFEAYHAGNASGAAERLAEWTWLHDALDELIVALPDRPESEWIAACRDTATAWTGDPDLARATRLLDGAVRDGDFQTELNVHAWLARCAFGAGRIDEAASHIEPFFRVGEAADLSVSEHTMLARYALHAGQLDRAQRALDAVGEGGGGIGDHDIGMVRAGLAALEGRHADALALYRAVLAGYREFGVKFDVALTILDMMAFLGADEPAVAALVPEARDTLDDLGARLLLERLDDLVAAAARSARSAIVTPRAPTARAVTTATDGD
jgi:class 3 adenylate cyclase/tetratricopeptide (TPR) repeat protein/ribosomal protein L40E